MFSKDFWDGIFRPILEQSPAKILLITACLVFGYLSVYMKDEIKDYVFPAQEVTQTGKPTDFSLPTTVSIEDQFAIKVDLQQTLRKSKIVGAVFLYEFMPPEDELLYQGRVVVTHASNMNHDLAQRYNQRWMPMNSDKYEVSAMLKGNAFHRDLTKVDVSPDGKKFTTQNVRLVVQDGFKYMVSVPVIDENLQVRGYLSAYLVDVPSSQELDYLLDDLEYQANELSRYL